MKEVHCDTSVVSIDLGNADSFGNGYMGSVLSVEYFVKVTRNREWISFRMQETACCSSVSTDRCHSDWGEFSWKLHSSYIC